MPSSQRSPTLVMLTLDRLEPRDLPAAFPSLPVVPAIDTAVQDRLQAVAERGARLGNREDVFVKVGDSITVAADFLKPIGRADYNPVANGLADHPELLAVRNSYLTPIGFENSFTRESAAAVPGRTSASALPTVAPELAAIRPAVSLVMLGTNDVVHGSPQFYRANLEAIVRTHLDLGVIPVLSTIPPLLTNGANSAVWTATVNQIVVDTGEAFDVPVWNYWAAMVGLPFGGIGDTVHPNVAPQGGGYFGPGGLSFGYNVRNFTALQVLDHVRDVVLDDGLPDGFAVPADRAWVPLPRGESVVATAAVPGGTPLVVLRDLNTGAVRNQFLAFDPLFRGGVSVAVGDVNADGIADAVVGPASGGGPRVRAVSGADGRELFSFFAYEPTFTGGVTLAVGDVTGDRIDDVVVGAGAGGGPRVRVFDPTTGEVVRDFLAFEDSFRGGVNVAVGGFGPGVGRAIAATPGAGGGGVVSLFDAATLAPLASLPVFADDYRGGANLAVGDVTGDGRDELVIGGGAGSNAVRVVRPETGGIAGEFAAGPASGLGVRVGVLPGGSGAIVAAVRDDPAGPVGVFDPAGNRLRSLADPIDEFFPLGVNVGA